MYAHRKTLAFLFIACSFAAIFKLGYLGTTPNSDYSSYVSTAESFSGMSVAAAPQRVLKPLAPLGVALFAPFVGLENAFLVEVLIFYAAFSLALYLLAWTFFSDKRLALAAALLGALSYPILRYGVDLYTETGAQFFFVFSLVLTLRYLKAPSRKLLALNALTIGVGLLWKEYSVVNGLIVGVVLLLEKVPWRAKVTNLALLAVLSLSPTLAVQAWVYSAYHYTYWNWYLSGGASGFATQFTIHNLVKSVGALLGLAWLLVPVGILRFDTLSTWQRRFLIVTIPATFIAFAWGFVSSRLFYVIAPAFILLAVFGISRTSRFLQAAALFVVIAGNLVWLTLAVHGFSL